MSNFLEQYTRMYYEQLYKSYQQQQMSVAAAPESVAQPKPKKKISNFSMASILEPEEEKKPESKIEIAAPIPIPVGPGNYWDMVYGQQQMPTLHHRAENPRVDNARKGADQKPKRIRTIFTQNQIDRLEVEFEKSQYMIGSDRVHLARELNLSETQVKIPSPSL